MLKKRINLVNTGIVHVKSTFNNTLICVTDLKGNVIVSGSGGSTGLKGQKRSTYYAAQATSVSISTKKFQEWNSKSLYSVRTVLVMAEKLVLKVFFLKS